MPLLKGSVRAFFWVATPKILAGGLQLVLSMALLRYFDPARFGIVSVCMSAVLLSDSVIGGATDSGVLRLAPSSNVAAPLRSLQFQQSGLILKLLLAASLFSFVLPFAKRISLLFFQTSHGTTYLAISLVALFGMLALRSVQMHYQVNERFVPYGISDLASSVLKFGGIALVLLLARPSPGAVLLLYASAPLAVAGVLLIFGSQSLLRVPFSRATLGELGSHVKWFVAVSATGTLMSRMDVFFVSSIGGVGSAGVYSAAQIAALIPQLIGSYIAVIFSPRIMPMWESGTLYKLYRDFQLSIAGCAILIFFLAPVFLTHFAGVIFPPAFERSVPTMLVLFPAGLCALVNFPLTILLLLFVKPRFLVALDCIFLPCLLFAYPWAIRTHGVIGAASVTSLAALLKTGIMQTVAWRLLRERLPQTFDSNLPSLLPLEEGPHA